MEFVCVQELRTELIMIKSLISVSCSIRFLRWTMLGVYVRISFCMGSLNPLPDMPGLSSSNSAANEDMMSKLWTNGDTFILLSRKHCGKRRNCSL